MNNRQRTLMARLIKCQSIRCLIVLTLAASVSACFGSGTMPKKTPAAPGPTATTVAPAIVTFTATPQEINEGEEIKIEWQTAGISYVKLEPMTDKLPANGSLKVTPTETTAYILRAFNPPPPPAPKPAPGKTPAKAEPATPSADKEVATRALTVKVTPKAGTVTPPKPPVYANIVTDNTKTCADVKPSELDLRDAVQFSVAPGDFLFSGEPLQIKWSFPGTAGTSQVMLFKDTVVIKEGGSNDIVEIVQKTTDYELEIKHCNVTTSIKKTIHVADWQSPDDLTNIATIYQPPINRSILIGTNNGLLFKKAHLKAPLTELFEDPLKTWFDDLDKNKKWDAGEKWHELYKSITGILTPIGGACSGDLFFGTEEGFVYRSRDQGETVTGSVVDETSFDWLTFLASIRKETVDFIQKYYAVGLPVNFLVQDPDPEKSSQIYIGHRAGLWRLEDCTDGRTLKFIPNEAAVTFANEDMVAAAVYNKTFYVASVSSGLYRRESQDDWRPVPEAQAGSIVYGLKVANGKLYVITPFSVITFDGSKWTSKTINNVQDILVTKNLTFYAKTTGISVERNDRPGEVTLNIKGSIIQLYLAKYFDQQEVWAVSAGGDLYTLSLQ